MSEEDPNIDVDVAGVVVAEVVEGKKELAGEEGGEDGIQVAIST